MKTGNSVFRTLISMDKIMADPVTAKVFEGEAAGYLRATASSDGVFIFMYPCRR